MGAKGPPGGVKGQQPCGVKGKRGLKAKHFRILKIHLHAVMQFPDI